ncbi:MAG: transporter substrate-binding domain-containing protein [Acidimicrobiia bacterium]|nr:transporter substrate-binding domain-containing protein [Acidimicrobiia bacterium]
MQHLNPSQAAITAIAPTGTLRAGINLSNFLLVTSTATDGTPVGVSPDMASALAAQLDVGVEYLTYPNPGDVADALTEWDIANIGAEPVRAEFINFTAAYAEIESTYLVPAGSPIETVEAVDQPGHTVCVKARAAYGLWLERNLKHAQLVQVESPDSSLEVFLERGLDALAGLRPGLMSDVEKIPGARVLDGRFSVVQQAIGTPRDRHPVGLEFLMRFVEEAKSSGLVADSIDRHGVTGLSVAGLR